MLALLARTILKLWGWRRKGELPDLPKYILVGAPHTSNWDFVLMILYSRVYGRKFSWMGKDNLFIFPFDLLFKRLGGIPINRRERTGAVQQIVEKIKESEEISLVITPEGTRKKTETWKSGFYHIALGAGIPLVLGFLDYDKKVGGVGPMVELTGDQEKDMEQIRSFYDTIAAKHPEKKSPVSLKRPS